jgi:hypothetical protein
MVVKILLVADETSEDHVEVASRVQVDTADPSWRATLVDTVALHAREGARHLQAQLALPSSPAACSFVPLAALVPSLVH